MSQPLRNLVALVLVAGGGVAVYSYKSSTTAFMDLQAAGIGADCNPRLIVCHERLNPVLRARLVDAGFPPGPKKYARVVRQAFKCPPTDGGSLSELIVPGFERFTTDNDGAETPDPSRCVDKPCADYAGFCGNGPKNVRLASDPPDCVRAPMGNSTCTRSEGDGGFRFFGEMNVFDKSLAGGSGCEAVGCTIFGGDLDGDL